MKEKATVRKIEGRILTVSCGTADQCAVCAGKGFCASPGAREFTVFNRFNISVTPGDSVEIVLPPGKTIWAGFMVLILPLILFCIFYLLGSRVFHIPGEGRNALLGLAGLAAGFGLSLLVNRGRKERNMPFVEKVVSE